MKYIQYYKQPELRTPVLVAAFAGWNDAADAATTAIKLLLDRWKPAKVAEIDLEEFLDFSETRPIVRSIDGVQRQIIWPTHQFFSQYAPDLTHDIILCLGVEPHLKWKTFSKQFLDVCTHFNVSKIVMLGALLADVPHSLTVPISSSSANTEFHDQLKTMEIHQSRYEGPTGILGVLQVASQRVHIPAASLWAAAPHYLAATPNIKVTAALLTALDTLLSFKLNLRDIQADAARFEEQITTLVARDPEASAYVRKLEEHVADIGGGEADRDDDSSSLFRTERSPGTGPLPSADALIHGIEELLREQRTNGQQQPDEGKENE